MSRGNPLVSRARNLRRQLDRIRAELVGVENGVLPFVEAEGWATPAEVARELSMSPQGANNALAALWRAGLIERERVPVPGGGKAYAYSALHVAINAAFPSSRVSPKEDA